MVVCPPCRMVPMGPALGACNRPSLRQGRVPLDTTEQRANEEEVIEKTTTQMYRAPEMVDLYLQRELTEKVDIWASMQQLLLLCCSCYDQYIKNGYGLRSVLYLLLSVLVHLTRAPSTGYFCLV